MPEPAKEILKEVLLQGGEVLMSHFGRLSGISRKESNNSILTEADLAADRAILEQLRSLPGTYNCLTEETGFIDKGAAHTWVVDPLDGTSNFAAGLPWFGVLIALLDQGTPILGGAYLPLEDQMYLAEKGKGAERNGIPLRASGASRLEDVLLAYSFDHSSSPGKTPGEMKLLEKISGRVINTRSTNSLCDFCYVADGRLGAAINQTTRIWDIAVPSLLVSEAGGTVTDISGNEIAFDVNQEAFDRNHTIVAAASGIHEELLQLIHA